MRQTIHQRTGRLVAGLVLASLPFAPALAADDSTQTRTLHQSFPFAEGATLRVANLAGRVTLAAGSGDEVVVDATLHARGEDGTETRRLLDGMQWVESHDRKGRPEWALSYPVEDYRGFAYPRGESDEDGSGGFWESLFGSFGGSTSSSYLGRRVRVVGRRSSSTPILYADLTVTFPAHGALAVRNVVGPIGGGKLAGDLFADTGSGKVEIEAFAGHLSVDTGSGSVVLGAVKGETSVDTGSGHIEVAELIGNASLDTGSGGVEVNRVSAGKLTIDTGSGGVRVREGTVGNLSVDTGSGGIEVRRVEIERFLGDTGSGGVTLESSLAQASEVTIKTGSGGVHIIAGPEASFDLDADQGSGGLHVGYADATLRRDGREVVGARRGDGRTRIHVETGSGSCTIEPTS